MTKHKNSNLNSSDNSNSDSSDSAVVTIVKVVKTTWHFINRQNVLRAAFCDLPCSLIQLDSRLREGLKNQLNLWSWSLGRVIVGQNSFWKKAGVYLNVFWYSRKIPFYKKEKMIFICVMRINGFEIFSLDLAAGANFPVF